LNYLKLAEETFPEDEKSKLHAYVLNKIGFVYFQLKKYDDAIVAFGNCIDLLESLGDLNEIPKIYCTLGLIYHDLKQSERANDMFQKAANIARMAGNEAEAQKYESLIL
jgi:tetratricopeptide (TPR) repeat protein